MIRSSLAAKIMLVIVIERTLKNVSAPIRVFRVIPPGVYEKVVSP